MKDCDELKDLFRLRLEGAERPVREGFWEELQGALTPAQGAEAAASGLKARTLLDASRRGASTRWVKVAASLLLLLGSATLLLWLTQPQVERMPVASSAEEEMADSFGLQSAAASVDDCSRAEEASTVSPLLAAQSLVHQRGAAMAREARVANLSPGDDEELVHVQVTIRIQEQGYLPHTRSSWQKASTDTHATSTASTSQQVEGQRNRELDEAERQSPSSLWALKAGFGSGLAKGDAHLPFTASVTAERQLNTRIGVEAGLRYNCLPHRGATYHTIQIPARLHCLLAASDKWALYALAGGSAEKCVAGAPSNSFTAEPVRLAVEGGVGVRYRLSDRLALFVEPTVSHHFSTDSANSSLRTERPTNFNLLCGLRVNY